MEYRKSIKHNNDNQFISYPLKLFLKGSGFSHETTALSSNGQAESFVQMIENCFGKCNCILNIYTICCVTTYTNPECRTIKCLETDETFINFISTFQKRNNIPCTKQYTHYNARNIMILCFRNPCSCHHYYMPKQTAIKQITNLYVINKLNSKNEFIISQ